MTEQDINPDLRRMFRPGGFAQETIDSSGIRWQYSQEIRGLICSPKGPNWFDLSSDQRATFVKSNAVRTVWRIICDDDDLHVKVYKGPRHRNKADAEGHSTHISRMIGVPTLIVRAIGHGATCSFLITETIPNAHMLSEAWTDASGNWRSQRGLIEAVAQLVGVANRVGFIHEDNHPGNILIEQIGNHRFKAYYVDIAKKGHSTKPRIDKRWESLAQLTQWFRLRSSRVQRLRFVRCYDAATRSPENAPMMAWQVAKGVYVKANLHAETLFRKRDSRIFKTNTYFAQRGNAIVVLKTRDVPDLVEPSVRIVEADEWDSMLQIEQPTGVRIVAADVKPASVIRAPQNRSTAHAHFHAAHRCLNRDIPTRRPIALVSQDKAILWLDTAPDSTTVEAALCHGTPRERTAAIRKIARTLRRMSDRGVVCTAITNDTFGLPTDSDFAIIETPTNIEFRNIDANRDRLHNARAAWRFFRQSNAITRTDAIRFMTAFAPAGWKRMILQMRKNP